MPTILPEYVTIHQAIHNENMNIVVINGIVHPILVSNNNCRYVDYVTSSGDKIRLMEQNKTKNSQFANRARNGERITWGIKPVGSWIFINDDTKVTTNLVT